MIGLGVDLCQIERIEAALAKSDAFANRYFTPEEQRYLESRGKSGSQSAAAMFAAKEALLKAMGVGLSGGIGLKEIGVSHDALGAPFYTLTGAALERLSSMGGTRTFLTLTHEDGMACAVAVIE
ncbi:MAG: holo-ACP synthase [Eubacteriales bacterium]|nr:holo-ACP synthase [Eubacteriales bacterium]